MATHIRLAGTVDADAVASLVECYWEFEQILGFDRIRVTALLCKFLGETERGACWLALESGQPIGYLLAVYVFSLEHGGLMAEIDELFVLAEHRSKGVGASLLRQAEHEMGRAGLKRLQLQLSSRNPGSKQFYQRMGFEFRRYDLMDKPLSEL